MQAYGRLYELLLTNVTAQADLAQLAPFSGTPVPSSIVSPELLYGSRSIPQSDLTNSRKWSDLRMQAKAGNNNTNSNTNNITVKLYNPSDKDLAFVTTAVTKRLLSLRAGYSTVYNNAQPDEFDRLPEVFTGDVVSIISYREGADLVMEITAKDTAASIRKGYVSKKFPAGTNKKEAIKELVEAWEGVHFSNNSIESSVKFKTPSFTSAYSAFGNIGQILSSMVKDEDIVWYINNSVFNMCSKTAPKFRRKISLTPTNVIDDISNVQQSNLNSKSPQGLVFKTFLDGTITTEHQVTLSGFDSVGGKTVDGDYSIRSVNHVLDTHGQPWYTECTVGAVN